MRRFCKLPSSIVRSKVSRENLIILFQLLTDLPKKLLLFLSLLKLSCLLTRSQEAIGMQDKLVRKLKNKRRRKRRRKVKKNKMIHDSYLDNL